MLTFIGKSMAFVNLVIGLGLLTWSVTLYTLQPGWFDPIPEAVDKGNKPVTFAQLKADITNYGRAANAASGAWGANLKALEEAEEKRAARKKVFATRLEWAHKGNPKDNGTGFYEPVAGPGGLIDVTKLGNPVPGPDGQPLKGADKLFATVKDDTDQILDDAAENEKLRKEYAKIGAAILVVQEKVEKMNVIRDSVQSELFFLSSFEVNVLETRETVLRRQRQLINRLAELK